MFSKIRKYFSKYRTSLFQVDQKELSRGSKLLLSIFLFTIFIIIGWGLSWQLDQTKSPHTEYGYLCKKLVDRSDKLDYRDVVSSSFIHKKSTFESLDFGTNSECQELGKRYYAFFKDKSFEKNNKTIKELEWKRSQYKYNVKKLEKSYSDMLLEKVAKQDKAHSIFSSDSTKIKSDIEKLKVQIMDSDQKIKQLSNLMHYPSYKHFNSYYTAKKESIKNSYQKAKRYYSVKQTMQAFIFLIPIWFLFYMIYRFMMYRKHYILSHLTLHVANVAALYALFFLISFIYDIMPKLYFQKIIAFFMQYNMAIVLNILAIVFFIILFGVVIYRVQKNDTTGVKKRKQEIENLKSGKCSECACLINSDYCPVCGFSHYKECPKCHHKTLTKGEFCQYCSESLGEDHL